MRKKFNLSKRSRCRKLKWVDIPKKENIMSKKKDAEPTVAEFPRPQTEGQREYMRILIENDVTFVTGDAGTGKSYLALGLAAQYLVEERFDKIIIARPAVEASKKGLGFLPGQLSEKMLPYVLPAIAHLKRFLGKDLYANMVRDDRIVFETLEYMRGSTYDYSFMILEESQNADVEQLTMFITRIGKESKILINGDIEQTDLRNKGENSDLLYVINKVRHLEGFGVAELTENDIVRNPLIKSFLRAMKKT